MKTECSISPKSMIRTLQSRLTSLSSVHVSLASIPQRLCRNHGRFVNEKVCAMQFERAKAYEEAANVLILLVPGWNLVHEGDTWKQHQSWKMKTFVKGMEFLELVADVAEAQGKCQLNLSGPNLLV